MVKITIDNLIHIDHETEIIHEEYKGDYHEKNGSHFLVYQNEMSEKVVMKYDTEMLTITRFSKPSTIMKMHPEVVTKTAIATPVGPQRFEIKTQLYKKSATGFKASYQFWQGETKIAQYDLEIHFSS
ncbi:DUF1934 domain-containing protein [Pseudolactococcus chungangensis]|jgi:uncharacterized beta-barrel protein YwiB (DUF1934 family)|uniref:DUF1934 domain-containing protein n=2 Tax=Pseudolactococcus chungangensis TaxID=451457 RepID=A0A1K2H921_9LACT|nr:DUF1934 domain-containing protein [Lactococcus chungangensis]NCB81094.1 DUF1934 domain-containing protein [Bacilli bacterium]MDD3015427.1 DUF1934 domain-containing protein [Lactococcus chungangensis]NLH35726.1 DUF1934 domain-containing protein [Lactococcus chungangensis]PCS04026.1 hypothetical protein RR45_GL001845 [Lactococcus chungangensis CAU 28 = DSM 22330]SFZ73294.1 protein of unknown function [Lactococcus chungangensis CAU 28 = DSM 22330]